MSTQDNTTQKTVKDVYGDTHVILQRHYDNTKKTFIPIISSSRTDDHASCLHRGNIIKDDTIGFQVINEQGDFWKHQANEAFECPEKAAKSAIEAMCHEPDNGWHTKQIAKVI